MGVSAFRGFPADLGGGGYDRQAFLLPPQSESFIVTVAQKPGAAQLRILAHEIVRGRPRDLHGDGSRQLGTDGRVDRIGTAAQVADTLRDDRIYRLLDLREAAE